MKTRLNLTLGLAAALALSLNAREVININPGWDFYAGADTTLTPVRVDLPHDFQISQPWVAPSADEKADMSNGVANIKSRLSARGFKEMGRGRYRKVLDVPADWKGKRVVLDFEGILLVGDAWLNGQPIGSTDYGYLGFQADVTDKLRYGAPNIIEVEADTRDPKNSRWYTGAGLYRDVNVILTDPSLHFERHPLYISTPEISDSEAKVVLQADIFSRVNKKTPFTASVTVTSPTGDTIVSNDYKVKTRHRSEEYVIDTLSISAPALWSCETPDLYTATVLLYRPDGSLADSISQRFGVRTVEYTPEQGLLLNGKKVLLKGIANHHTLGALGAAAHPDAMRKRLSMLKDWGFNHVRTSHNPYSSSFLDLCDEMGILVVDELYDKWLTQYAGGRRDWMTLWPEDIPEWVTRDRNHPCVIMWSLGNELQTLWDIPYRDWGVTPYRMQRELLKRFDTSRPTTVAMHPRGRDQSTDSLPAPLARETDIASYNYRFMYFPGDSRRFPWMKFYQSEASTSRLPGSWFGMDLDKVIGLAYWGAIDYLGESQGWPAKGWDKGVFDISLHPKPTAWHLRSFFVPEEPTVHIAVVESTDATVWNDVMVGTGTMSDHWNYRPGATLKLYTFTNGDEVELIVNGKSLGRRPNPVDDPENRNAVLWESVPYSPGYAEAIAYRDGKKIASHRVETAGKAVKLVATVDPDTPSDYVASPGGRLHHISVKAIDSKGRTVPTENALLTFSIDGPATLAGVVNGDHNSDELYTGETRSLFRGRAAAIVRRNPGSDTTTPVTLRISAPGLKSTSVKM